LRVIVVALSDVGILVNELTDEVAILGLANGALAWRLISGRIAHISLRESFASQRRQRRGPDIIFLILVCVSVKLVYYAQVSRSLVYVPIRPHCYVTVTDRS